VGGVFDCSFSYLNSWSRVFLQKLIGAQVVKFSPFMESEISLPLHTFSLSFLKIHFMIILPSIPRSSKWALPFRFSYQILYTFLLFICYINVFYLERSYAVL